MRVGIIGFGNMGSAFAQGLKDVSEVLVYDKDETKREQALSLGFGTAKSIEFLLPCDFLLLAVKPKDVQEVLLGLKGKLKGEVLVSVVAGLSIEKILQFVGQDVKVIRTMPNLNVKVKMGAIAFCSTENIPNRVKEKFVDIFSSCGKLYEIEEGLIDAFTALAGSGPAFVFKFIQGLSMAGVMEGFSYSVALDIVLQTLRGSCELLLKEGGHPEEWISRVASPSGTTIEGLKVLEERAFIGTILECVRQTSQKAKKL